MHEMALPYFFACPAADPPWPGVVVVHEGNGISPQLLRVCQRIAAEGYAALAPDLFWRFGGSDPGKFLDHLGRIRIEEVRSDLATAVWRLKELGSSHVGLVGFVLGGRLTYEAARANLELACAATFYGAGIAQDLGDLGCPLLAFFGGTDEYIPAADIQAVQEFHGGDVVVYPEASHGFM